jgi:nucleotide-binding universal stress UspA family protein
MSTAIDRVIVPLDAASENRAAIETAARLAARVKAPLHGVFVEDEELLRGAALSFTRQVILGVGIQPFTLEDTELHLKAAAETARRELVAAARRHRIECSFEVVRGAAETALSGASKRDLVVAGALARPVAGHFRLECRWWSSIDIVPGPLLLARHRAEAAGSVVALLDERGPTSARLLATAAHLAEAGDGRLSVIATAALADVADFNDWLGEQLAGFRVRLLVEVASGEPAALRRRIGELGCRLLAVEAGSVDRGAARLREFAESFACEILIVR